MYGSGNAVEEFGDWTLLECSDSGGRWCYQQGMPEGLGSSTASWSPGIYDNFLVKKQMLGLAGNSIQRRGQRCRVYWDIRSKNDSDCKIQIPHSMAIW